MFTASAAAKPPEEQYLSCIRCGACLPVCPTYREQLHEAASPRGRVALARKEREGELRYSRHLDATIAGCLGCMACDAACSVGIKPASLARGERAWHENYRHAYWKHLLFGEVLVRPRLLEAATAPLRWADRSGLREAAASIRPYGKLPQRLSATNSMLPSVPRQPLRSVLPEVSASRRTLSIHLVC